ncbi:MAG: LysM peptidoglycan-binding domain-containing protein [Candidatus Marinimicrobia bacterium]|nr:LysM peptidoglycan-binding domain-containing protein [Candidatus Neomarinimicrobiota bacterium]
MKLRLGILLLLTAIISSSCFSGSQETIREAGPSTISEMNTVNDTGKNEISTEIVAVDEPMEFITPFDQYLTQAKVHYVDALLAQDDEDSLEVEFQLSIIFDILAKVESYNGMDEIQYEQFKVFTDRIIREFDEYAPQMRELHEQFSLSDLKDAMGVLTDDYFAGDGNKDYVVLEDRDGHVPIMINSRVETSIKMFQTKRPGDMQKWIKTKAVYERLFRKILRENGVPEEFIYLSMLESEMKTDARSYVGAMGQWQFMSYTAKSFGLKYDYWVDERRDPIKATEAAAKYMLYLYEEFNDWYLVMAAYNAGEGRLARSIRYEHTRDYWQMKTLPRATRKYVPHIVAVAAICMDPEKYGFTDYKPKSIWGDFDTLSLDQSYELEKIARVCNIKFNKLRELNPELRKLNTPAYKYTIRLPKGKRAILEREILVMEASPTHIVYKVKSGDTLSEIALKYGMTVQDIVKANKLTSKSRIYIGQKLILPQGGLPYLASGSTYTSKTSSSSSGKPNLSASHRKIIYTVKPGDTLGDIAEIYDTRASRIRVWNGLVYGEFIHPKQKLTIWVPKGNSYQTIAQYYTVKRGDSFEKIAGKYGLSAKELKKLNPSMNYSKIYPGDKIRIQ